MQRFLEVSDAFCVLTATAARSCSPGRDRGRTDRRGPQRAAAIASAKRSIGVVYEPEICRKDGTLRALEVSTLVLDRSSPGDVADSAVPGFSGFWGVLLVSTDRPRLGRGGEVERFGLERGGWVSFSKVLAWPCRRVVFRVWVESSVSSVR